MKKVISTFWILTLSLGCLFSLTAQDARAQLPAGPIVLQNIAADISSPETLAKFMWKNFVYESDRRNKGKDEYWQSPEEFLSSQKGDCEDFALFARAILQMKGYKAFLVNVYGTRFAHTICVFEEAGKFNVIDGTDVRRYEAENLNQLLTEVYPHWKSGAIVAPSGKAKRGRILKQFERDIQLKHMMKAAA